MGNNLHVKFSGNVEIDDTYIGGKGKGKRGRGAEKKTIILGILARKGNVKGEVVKNMKKETITPIIKNNITAGARISTDEFSSYRNLKKEGYFHDYVKHAVKEYVRSDCHIQSIEGFWSRLKNSISGTHIWVSKKHLQKYIEEFAFRYNQRRNGNFMFFALLAHLNKPYESIH